ncbi:hypothetical protein HHK36_010662 [Tetracentron sinense]|uniref:Uncharacterized protein n=1 Tax=Tetracentron sinense TaxID=13715 RepID=A0A834Z8Y1_TETSI|nr:hypothetical protein HHK36_010662 [Tetracentron sinense]
MIATVDGDERRRRLLLSTPSPELSPPVPDQMAFAAPSGSCPAGNRPYCQHCRKPGHVIDHCFDLHPELKQRYSRNRDQGNKDRGKWAPRTSIIAEVAPASSISDYSQLQSQIAQLQSHLGLEDASSTTISFASPTATLATDKKNPHTGVIVKMSSNDPKLNCSVSVSVFCDSNGVQATVLRHPSGCAKIISVHGKGWGWFSTLIIIFVCLLGGYLLAGTVYRFFILGVHGIEVIPNLDFWITLPRRTQHTIDSKLILRYAYAILIVSFLITYAILMSKLVSFLSNSLSGGIRLRLYLWQEDSENLLKVIEIPTPLSTSEQCRFLDIELCDEAHSTGKWERILFFDNALMVGQSSLLALSKHNFKFFHR